MHKKCTIMFYSYLNQKRRNLRMSQYLPILVALICPLMMIFMMFTMFGGKKDKNQHSDSNRNSFDSDISGLRKENQELKKELLSIKSVLTSK